jgi:hypothetical protein
MGMTTSISDKEKEKRVKKNIRFILSHFNNQSYNYPKAIKTLKTKGNSVYIQNEKEIINYFLDADFMDCKINGYPLHYNNSKKKIYPNFIFIDLDLSLCNICKYPDKKLDYILNETLRKIEKEINGFPTVLWTGDGYHIYQPIELDTKVFDKEKNENTTLRNNVEKEFSNQNNKNNKKFINEFLRFSIKYLTNNQKNFDYNSISTDYCFTIAPESIASKTDNKVNINQKWNGHRANANTILKEFLILNNGVQF